MAELTADEQLLFNFMGGGGGDWVMLTETDYRGLAEDYGWTHDRVDAAWAGLKSKGYLVRQEAYLLVTPEVDNGKAR